MLQGLAEVDVVGAGRLRGVYPNCVTIFVTAPPKELIRRVLKRQDDAMDHDKLVQRMHIAREQIRVAAGANRRQHRTLADWN